MSDLGEFNRYGEELEASLILRSSPIAVKMLQEEADVPEGAIRPARDRGYHLAQCQAFAMSRREGTTVAMLKEDHWCPSAVMALWISLGLTSKFTIVSWAFCPRGAGYVATTSSG